MQKVRNFKLSVEYGKVIKGEGIPVIDNEGRAAHTLPEPEQDVILHITFPDGKKIKKTITVYTLCHGENPEVNLIPLLENSWGTSSCKSEKEKEEAVTIMFPDGSLHVWPNHTVLWED
jgi:hypothetical protein